MSNKKYDIEQCMKVIIDFLPTGMKTRIGPGKITIILATYYRYLALSEVVENRKNLNLPTAHVDLCEAGPFIIKKCLENGFVFSLEEVQCVLDGEFQYMCDEGIVNVDPEHVEKLEKKV